MVTNKASGSTRPYDKDPGFCFIGSSTLFSLIENTGFIKPFDRELISCNGVDLRLANEYCQLNPINKVYDTHKKNPANFYYSKEKSSELLVNPNDRFLVCTIERFKMPKNLIGFVGLRSSYCRLGLQMPVGFIDPGFVGQLTMEIIGGVFPILLHARDKVFHAVFAKVKDASENAYHGKYQNQKGVIPPIFPE